MSSLNQTLSQPPVTSLFDNAAMVLRIVWNALLWYKTLSLQNKALSCLCISISQDFFNENTTNKDEDNQKGFLVFVVGVPCLLEFFLFFLDNKTVLHPDKGKTPQSSSIKTLLPFCLLTVWPGTSTKIAQSTNEGKTQPKVYWVIGNSVYFCFWCGHRGM